MKKLSKLLSLVLVVVLSMSLMACGNSSDSSDKKSSKKSVKASADMTLEDLMSKMQEASDDVKGMKATAKISGKAAYAGQDMEMSVDMDMESDLSNVEEPGIHMNADYTISASGQDMEMSMEMYEIVEDQKAKVYTNVYDQWSYQESDMADMESQYGFDADSISELMEGFDYSSITDQLDEASVKADGTEYVVTLNTSTDNVKTILSSFGLDSYVSAYESMIPDAELGLTLNIDAATYLPTEFKLTFDMDDMEIEGTTISVSDVEFDCKYTSYDKVEITVPDEALEAAE